MGFWSIRHYLPCNFSRMTRLLHLCSTNATFFPLLQSTHRYILITNWTGLLTLMPITKKDRADSSSLDSLNPLIYARRFCTCFITQSWPVSSSILIVCWGDNVTDKNSKKLDGLVRRAGEESGFSGGYYQTYNRLLEPNNCEPPQLLLSPVFLFTSIYDL